MKLLKNSALKVWVFLLCEKLICLLLVWEENFSTQSPSTLILIWKWKSSIFLQKLPQQL